MKINWKEQLKLSFIYTIIGAIPPLLQILVQPIIEGYDRLDTVQFSYLAITESISTLAFTIALFAMGGALQRYYYDYRDSLKDYKRLVSTTFLSIIFRGFILVGLCLVLAPYIGKIFSQQALQNFETYGYYAVVIGINRAINITAITLYRNEKRVQRFIAINIFLAVFRIGFQIIGIFYWDMSFIGYLQGSMIGGGIVAIYILWYSFKNSGIHFDRTIHKKLAKFSFPLFQSGLITWGILFADRYFLESHPIDLGIYDTAIKFSFGLSMILQGLQGAFQPEVYRYMSGGFKENESQIKGLSQGMMAISQLLVAALIPATMLYLHFLYETEIRFAAGIVGIIFIKGILRTQFMVFVWPIYFLKETKFLLRINILVLVVNLTLNYFLIPKYQAYGAITASIVSDLILVIGCYIKQKKLIQIKWNLNKLIISPFLIIFIAVVMEFAKIRYDLNIFLSSAVSVFSILAVLIFLYKIEIKELLNRFVRSSS